MAKKAKKKKIIGHIKVGKNFWMSNTSRIFNHKDSYFIAGDNVFISGEAIIINHFHDLSLGGDLKKDAPSTKFFNNNVFIGYRAIILPQVRRIGKNAVIGAGSVVANDIPDNEVWAGNPAKKIKMRT
jgi:acetyltransferase-like isoleucine patch superfamily enzyme